MADKSSELAALSAKKQVENQALIGKLEAVRTTLNAANKENNDLRGKVAELQALVDKFDSVRSEYKKTHAAEVLVLKGTVDSLAGADVRAAKAEKALAPLQAKLESVEKDLAEFKADYDNVVSENRRLTDEYAKVNQKISDVLDAVRVLV